MSLLQDIIRVGITNIGGAVVKEDERYVVKDNKTLTDLTLSSTVLNTECSTTGHKHAGQEEIYFFVDGRGSMQVGKRTFTVKGGDIVLIPDGAFHRVRNLSDSRDGFIPLTFICVFNGGREE